MSNSHSHGPFVPLWFGCIFLFFEENPPIEVKVFIDKNGRGIKFRICLCCKHVININSSGRGVVWGFFLFLSLINVAEKSIYLEVENESLARAVKTFYSETQHSPKYQIGPKEATVT